MFALIVLPLLIKGFLVNNHYLLVSFKLFLLQTFDKFLMFISLQTLV